MLVAAVDGVIQYWGHGAPLGGVPHSMDAHREEVIPFPDPSGCTNQDISVWWQDVFNTFQTLTHLHFYQQSGENSGTEPWGVVAGGRSPMIRNCLPACFRAVFDLG